MSIFQSTSIFEDSIKKFYLRLITPAFESIRINLSEKFKTLMSVWVAVLHTLSLLPDIVPMNRAFINSFAFSDSAEASRVEKWLLSDQACMELLVMGFDDVAREQNSDGSFKEIKHWHGLEFSEDNRVVSIYFDDLCEVERELAGADEEDGGFGGGGLIDLRWIPSHVQFFEVMSLNFAGSLDTKDLPEGLITLNVVQNHLEGSFRIECLPNNIEEIRIDRNKFYGKLNLAAFPKSVVRFHAKGNMFEGCVDMTNFPPNMSTIDLSANHLGGSIEIRNLPMSMRSIILHWNKFEYTRVIVEKTESLETISLDAYLKCRVFDSQNRMHISKLIQYRAPSIF